MIRCSVCGADDPLGEAGFTGWLGKIWTCEPHRAVVARRLSGFYTIGQVREAVDALVEERRALAFAAGDGAIVGWINEALDHEDCERRKARVYSKLYGLDSRDLEAKLFCAMKRETWDAAVAEDPEAFRKLVDAVSPSEAVAAQNALWEHANERFRFLLTGDLVGPKLR